eukprot:GILJ01001972.1.p1 GENE.GILJ01001972.1~~GILJ01001972.1.p1  ORF type:complete len:520 (+),score=54.03 GILJ01001972.1:91-1560(+)
MDGELLSKSSLMSEDSRRGDASNRGRTHAHMQHSISSASTESAMRKEKYGLPILPVIRGDRAASTDNVSVKDVLAHAKRSTTQKSLGYSASVASFKREGKFTEKRAQFEYLVDHLSALSGSSDLFNISCSFDLMQYKLGPYSVQETPAAQCKPGPLMQIFMFYAKIFSPSAGNFSFDHLHIANSTTSFAEFLAFAKDFRLYPDVLCRSEIEAVFQEIRKNRRLDESDGAMRKFELDYTEFCECLVRCALCACCKPPNHPEATSAIEKVEALIEYLGLKDATATKRKIDQAKKDIANKGKRKQENLVMRKHTKSIIAVPIPHGKLMLREPSRHTTTYDVSLLKLFKPYERVWPTCQWRSFGGPFIDMGVVSLGSHAHYRLAFTNCSADVMRLEASVSGLPHGVELVSKMHSMAPGLQTVLTLEAKFDIVGEWLGEIKLTFITKQDGVSGMETIPVYMWVVDENSSMATIANLLPPRAPRPWQRPIKLQTA